jgi:hypothetical protein
MTNFFESGFRIRNNRLMQQSIKKDRFIPFRKTDLIQAYLDDGGLFCEQQKHLKHFVS